ncbi:MAG TPA: hypothetical protein VKT73_10230 [Xanthobacteraceae bacterium]|nr:hypothetical protein [Xanthobacteraceae bacterium]
MNGKMYLVAASLIGLTCAVLPPAPTQANPGSGAFAPVADNALVRVADLSVEPMEPRRWRYDHRRSVHAWRRPARPYYEPYAYYPAYRYGGYAVYACCEAYAVYPVYERPYYRPFSYSPLGRYYYVDDPRFYLPGFYGGTNSYYYW